MKFMLLEQFSYTMTTSMQKNGHTDNFFNPHFYLQTVQMQVHLANGVMGGEAGRGAPISTPL
jgi:hypothetical protein